MMEAHYLMACHVGCLARCEPGQHVQFRYSPIVDCGLRLPFRFDMFGLEALA